MRGQVAFQAAEAGLATALATSTETRRRRSRPPTSVWSGTIPRGQPRYQLDPAAATPIENLGAVPAPGMSLNINGSGPTFQLRMWRIHVEGSEPRGMTSRVEAAAAAL
ncbi:MAG: hypothetical protein R3E53_14580 [Myxococcota bacterium]